MRSGWTGMALGTAAVAWAVPLCAGQDTGLSVWDAMRRVEPGRSDLGRLAVESRIEPVEMRLTQGFETLWRGAGRDGQTWFARRDGGVTAVFDRSTYQETATGQMPLIPAGTTFVIGEPDSILASRLGIEPIRTGPGPGLTGDVVRDASGGLREDTRFVEGAHEADAERREQLADPADRQGVFGLLRRAAAHEKSNR